MGSQGQDLIQKKACLAVTDALKQFKPEEILVIVMWSGTERKSFYVDNPDFIEEVVKGWKMGSHWWGRQFCTLRNKVDQNIFVEDSKSGGKTYYNKEGGWYICNYLFPDSNFTQNYFDLTSTILGPAINSLENIIFLQNFCKVKGIKLAQTFYRNYVWTDIEENAENENLGYLFENIDHDTIVSKTGMYEYLRPYNAEKAVYDNFSKIFWKIMQVYKTDETAKYFLDDNWHPNELGATKWLNEVLIPYLFKIVAPTTM
ncbi:MAG: hypothetical protein EBX47_08820 [Synechococcaceae bacterium WB8_1B_057]|nr:hypothetical protein [Synechococcaceae bacterium WB6_1A_059]NDG79516.1 hypothetical protein [Synechococcaceae bacterium WB8_1B_057]